jgi:vitamin B12 transporter
MKKFQLAPLFIAIIALPAISATEELIVTGSYSPVTNEQLSSSVSVIDHEQLLQLSSHSVIDALRQIPSLWVEEQGGPGGVTSISLRGAEANHTLVLLDGVQLNDPTNTRGGAFDLNGINIESIERIEIIRGAQSAVYGSDALAGVIHIITQAPGKKTTQFNATLGSDDYSSVGVSTSGSINNLGYAFSLQGKDAGEPVKGSTAENTEFTSRLNWQQDAHAINFNYRYFDGERTSFPEQSGGPEFAQLRDLDTSEYTDQNAALGWTMQVNDFWQSKTQASWYQRDEDMKSPGVPPFLASPPNGAIVDFTRTQFTWINTLGNQNKLWANIGVENKREDGVSEGYIYSRDAFATDFALTRDIDSAFINLNAYANNNWLWQASVRRDDPKNLSARDTGQIGTRYQINESVAVFANWGQGFKLPSFFAIGHPSVGNPALKPETVTTTDAGIEFSQNQITSRISLFNHKYRDLIDYDSEISKNVNRSKVKTSGVETEASWQVQENLDLRVHATYTDIDMQSADSHLLGRPQVTYGSSLHYALNDEWNFNVNYLRVDERFAASLYTGESVEQTLAAYNRLDASVQWKINKLTQLGLSVENLANENYYTDIGFPAAGASAKVNLKISF